MPKTAGNTPGAPGSGSGKAATPQPKPASPSARSPAPAKAPAKASGAAKKPVRIPVQSGTHAGRLTIAVLAGLALGLVALIIYGMSGSRTPWVFDRPEAQLPSPQQKHTLY